MRFLLTLFCWAFLATCQAGAANRIDGTLVEAGTQQPIAGATVSAFLFTPNVASVQSVRTASTDANGAFVIDELASDGPYMVQVVAEGYVARSYGRDLIGRDCPAPYKTETCFLGGGAALIYFGTTATALTIPMETSRAGRVRGRLLSSTPGGLNGAEVRFRLGPSETSLAVTDTFDIDHVPPGEYVIFGCADGKVCRDPNGIETDLFGSSVPLATVTVEPGLISDLSDIILQPEARIGITVQPPAGWVFSAPPTIGLWREGSTTTMHLAAAWSAVQTGLRAGVYKLLVSVPDDPLWLAHWFGGPDCTSGPCGPELGLPLVLESGDDLTGLTTEINARQTISGRVTSASTGSAIAGVTVSASIPAIFVNGLLSVSQSLTDADGRYTLFGIGPDTYFLQASASGNQLWITEQWPEIRCAETDRPYCGQPGQQRIPLILDQNIADIDFTLELGGRISGTVEDPQLPAQCAFDAYLRVYSTLQPPPSESLNHFCSSGSSWSSGNLPAGNYWAAAGARTSTYMPLFQAFQGIACQGDLHLCNFALATPITVVPGAVTTGIDFEFDTQEFISRSGFE
ncbi:MAG: carboxypeptidase-like regulatory domain-containing protein [Lysobacterales bacterium]